MKRLHLLGLLVACCLSAGGVPSACVGSDCDLYPGAAERRLQPSGECSEGWQGCQDTRCCAAGFACYAQSAYYAQCVSEDACPASWDCSLLTKDNAGQTNIGSGPTEPPLEDAWTAGYPPSRRTKAPGSLLPLYSEALRKSFLFYEAQRSGRLPADQRVTWRGDSALKDGADNGVDLTGGYYDAGDGIKFNLPMASALSLVAWALVDAPQGFASSGQGAYALAMLKWGADYLMKCHPDPELVYVQVGVAAEDHLYWQRPEDMEMPRPSYKVDVNNPGSDVAAAMGAALASASVAFSRAAQSDDAELHAVVGSPSSTALYADTLLQHATELYAFANAYRGRYSDVLGTNTMYPSSGFLDELCWNAAWLHRATGASDMLQAAQEHDLASIAEEDGAVPWAASWDNHSPWCRAMLLQLTGDSTYQAKLDTFLNPWLPADLRTMPVEEPLPYLPSGMVFREKWGSNRYAANAALVAMMYARVVGGVAGQEDATGRGPQLHEWGRNQVDIMLGNVEGGRSYMVGFGPNPPKSPHHRGASCRPRPSPCDWDTFAAQTPNPNVLVGALVGGPDGTGYYVDKRQDPFRNEVTLDYNAGLTAALALLIEENAAAVAAGNTATDAPASDDSVATGGSSVVTPRPTTKKAATTTKKSTSSTAKPSVVTKKVTTTTTRTTTWTRSPIAYWVPPPGWYQAIEAGSALPTTRAPATNTNSGGAGTGAASAEKGEDFEYGAVVFKREKSGGVRVVLGLAAGVCALAALL